MWIRFAGKIVLFHIFKKFWKNRRTEMAVCYNKLFKLMIDKKISNNELASKAGVSLNIITRLKRDQYVAMDTIEKICIALECSVDEILEFIPEDR
jgi:DNA-binding Xre family transcriptional regulator